MIIDVSEHNGVINWEKVKKSGVTAVFIRAGWGITEDKRFRFNAAECEKLGIQYGIYWFASGLYNAELQARKCLEVIGKSVFVFPVFCDYEISVDKTEMVSFCNDFCERIRAAGYNAGIYSNAERLKLLPEEVLSDFIIWCADWRGSCGCKYASYWQYTDKGKIPGIDTSVDLSKVNSPPKSIDDYACEVIAGKYGNGLFRAARLKSAGVNPHSVQARVNDYYTAAKGVIAGKYGNGNNRRVALTKAGYDYYTVQSIVNVLLKG